MAQRSSDCDDGVDVRTKVSQFSNAQERMQSVLVRTGGVLPGSVPKIGEQAFVKNRITKFSQKPQTDTTSNNWDCPDEEKSHPEFWETCDDNRAHNKVQLEKLKRQLQENESNEEKAESSPSPVGGSFEFADQKTVAVKSAAVAPAAVKRTEARAELLGIIEVRSPLRNLPTDRKKRLAQICQLAVAAETPCTSEDELELGPIIAGQQSVSVLMEGDTVTIMAANAVGGGVHEMARHSLHQVAAVVHTSQNKVLVYIGRDAMSRRTAVIVKIPDVVDYTHIVAHFTINKNSK